MVFQDVKQHTQGTISVAEQKQNDLIQIKKKQKE